jgi:hypothetical protein
MLRHDVLLRHETAGASVAATFSKMAQSAGSWPGDADLQHSRFNIRT